MNDHKSTDLYLKMLTTFAYLYICLCGSCAVGVLVAVENYHLGIVTTSPPPPPIFTWDPATLQSLKNENIFCIMIISNKIIISIQNDNIYSENWWVLALLWSRMERWSGLTSKSCICCILLQYLDKSYCHAVSFNVCFIAWLEKDVFVKLFWTS